MDLKNQTEQDMQPNKRHHLLRRLSKAVAHASELVRLTSARCDDRSNIEAEAYSAWISGTFLLEKETNWEGALSAFVRCRQLLESLFQVGDFEQRATYRHFLNQVEPAVRFCEYQISRRGGTGADVSALLASASAGTGPGSDVLTSKLSSLMAEAQAQKAGSTTEISWNGETLAVRDDRCRMAVTAAHELEAQLREEIDGGGQQSGEAQAMEGVEGGVDPRIALYDRTINAYSEARAAGRAAMQTSTQGEGAEEARTELEALGRALHGLELQHTIARNLTLAEVAADKLKATLRRQLVAKFGGGTGTGSASVKDKSKDGERPARAEDVVRLYDTLVANVSELNDLAAAVGGAAGEVLMDECAAKTAQYQASRCLYAAHASLAASQFVQASVLFQRAEERCFQAISKHDDCATVDEAAKKALEEQGREAKAFGAVAAAEIRAGELKEASTAAQQVEDQLVLGDGEGEGVSGGLKRTRSDAANANAAGAEYLVDNLDRWEAFAGVNCPQPRIARIPPPPPLVPIRPIVLDTALMCIEPPSVEHRAPKRQAGGGGGGAGAEGGMVSRLFGWGRG